MKNELEILDQIQKVKTPPFLYTRIESKINEIVEPVYSFKLVLSMSFVLLILAIVNVNVLQTNQITQNKSEINIIVKEINSSNQLYYE